MQVSFVNKYTVGKEGHQPFHISPTRRQEEAEAHGGPTARVEKLGGIVRLVGLAAALGIVVVAIIGKMTPFIFIGGIFAAIYGMRIMHKRGQSSERRKMPAPPLDSSLSGKWIRYIRFGDHIEKIDPEGSDRYEYCQVDRITDDPAYVTLWMDDGSQVRVQKKGFTIGTLEAFEQFITAETGKPISRPENQEDQTETEEASEANDL